MTIPLYPEIIYEGDLSPDAVGEDIEEKVEVCVCQFDDGKIFPLP